MYLGFNPKTSRPEWMICTVFREKYFSYNLGVVILRQNPNNLISVWVPPERTVSHFVLWSSTQTMSDPLSIKINGRRQLVVSKNIAFNLLKQVL